MRRALLALSAFVPFIVGAQSSPPPPPPEVSTSGFAEVRLPADRVLMRFVVQSGAATAAQAASLNGDRVRRVLAALGRLGFRGDDARATGFSVAPNYDYREQRRLIDYQARTQVEVNLKDMERMGAILDAALGAGATEVGGMQFVSDTAEKARINAIAVAFADAKTEATALVTAAGKQLGPVISMTTGAMPVAFDGMQRVQLSGAAAGGAPNVEREVVVSFRVQVRWAIAP
jgi:uncharacterized protein YggE